ncbi:response regulator [Phenylobacterium montanum]|uniref:histidine kinase n=2 Tax=Phenylobacterium montanum TaxID=2823693 RepID=A0A975G501_9CAUL|nr:response regulator [Caulobacter sp. S6]
MSWMRLKTVASVFLLALAANILVAFAVRALSPLTLLCAVIAAALSSIPLSLLVLGQRRMAAEALESAAQKNRVIAEIQQRRQEAEESSAGAERALDRLARSEGLYRLLADNQTDVITLWTQDLKRKYTSPSVKRTLGFTPEELQEQPALLEVHPEDAGRIRGVLEGLKPGGEPVVAEYRVHLKDGSEAWVESMVRRLDGDGELLSTSRVINRRKALEDALLRALSEAKAAGQAKSDFLANMTHELRTPLNAIIGFSEVLKTSEELSPAGARHLALIADASHTLLGVVNDVLDFSRLEAGAVEPELAPFDPRSLVESAVAMLAGQAEAKGVALEIAAAGPGDRLMGDEPRLRQVLLNFLSNAIKFTSRGRVCVRLSQTEAGEVRRLRIAVEDTGIGISTEQLPSLFDRFTQADASTSRQYGGTGLGLAISKRIMEALGGSVGVESRIGEGSTFWFEIVLEAAPDQPVRATRASTAAADIDPAMRLLVVDDNAVNRELICTLLSPFDLEVETAQDGVEAVEAALRTPFDLILMDVQMPNMDGLTATRRIREAAQLGARRPVILAMTANVLPEQVARCLEAGMDGHLGKPISAERLLAAIASPYPGAKEHTGAAATA